MVETWMIVLGLLNLVLLLIGLFVILPWRWWREVRGFSQDIFHVHLPMIALIVAVVLIHLAEVHFIDSVATAVVGQDFTAVFTSIEDSAVRWLVQNWYPPLVTVCVYIYIGIYPFTLWFTPLFFLLTNNTRAMKTFAVSLLFVYIIALPFYLFFPITNVYTYFHEPSALNTVLPNVEQFFYSTTTTNNCFPSLHVAMALLVFLSVLITKNKRYIALTGFSAGGVIFSVLYLGIHWITDVIGGAILAIGVFYLMTRWIRGPYARQIND
jgi:membrane-associated phospholipid phosphatase